MRQLVARTPCPYRGLNDFRSFVRSRKIVRTRIRTPHPSACGCHLPPLGKALVKCEHRLKPKNSANNVTAGCKHTPLRSVASLLRKHCPRPTKVTLYAVHIRGGLFFSQQTEPHPIHTPVAFYFPSANLSAPNRSLIYTPLATYLHSSAG